MSDAMTPFVGRTTETRHLEVVLANARAGQGGAVLLAGEPGIGGHSTKAMATTLMISVPTAERHITHIYEKLGVNSRAEATVYALRQSLL